MDFDDKVKIRRRKMTVSFEWKDTEKKRKKSSQKNIDNTDSKYRHQASIHPLKRKYTTNF